MRRAEREGGGEERVGIREMVRVKLNGIHRNREMRFTFRYDYELWYVWVMMCCIFSTGMRDCFNGEIRFKWFKAEQEMFNVYWIGRQALRGMSFNVTLGRQWEAVAAASSPIAFGKMIIYLCRRVWFANRAKNYICVMLITISHSTGTHLTLGWRVTNMDTSHAKWR